VCVCMSRAEESNGATAKETASAESKRDGAHGSRVCSIDPGVLQCSPVSQ
jgi:hypothetical protein